METEDPVEESKRPENVDTAWQHVFGGYLTIAELFRCRRVCKNFKYYVNQYIKDNTRRKVVYGDDELAALYRMDIYPPILQVEGSKITLSGLQPLIAYGCLQDLKVVDCDLVNDQAFVALASNSRYLRNIEIDCRAASLASRNGYNSTRPTNITDQAIKAIATGCPDLECLTLIWVRQVTDDAFLEVFGRCPRLRILKLHWSRISDKALQSIGEKDNLEELDVRTCKDVGDNGIRPLIKSCSNIRRLYLVDVQCTNETLKELTTCGRSGQLETLFLSDLVHVSDEGLMAVAAGISSNLHTLHLSHIKATTNQGVTALLEAAKDLKDLTIAYLPISDETMNAIASSTSALKSLKVARFDGLKEITDNGLTSFVKSCSKLSLMECLNSKTTEACAKALRNPALSVILSAW